MITSSINAALQGLQANQKTFLESARRISREGTGLSPQEGHAPGPEADLVGLMTSRRGYEANLQTLRVADEMLGSLLDVLA